MKKLYSLLLTLVALTAMAQNSSNQLFSKVKHWSGEGSKKAALVIAWHDGLQNDTLLWGYRFEAPTTSAQMLEDVVKSDPRLYAAVSKGQYGLYVEGLGYDRNNNASLIQYSHEALTTSLVANGWWMRPTSGSVTATDRSDHFYGGYDATTGRYFAHLVSDGSSDFKSSQGASTHQLTDGCIDVWSYQSWGKPFVLSTSAAAPSVPYYKQGVFVINEDQFGQHSGSLNYLDTESKAWTYRAFQKANPGQTLGTTTQYATIYGGRFYFLSKQNFGQAGGRFVVANAANLSQIINELNLPDNSDGRAIEFDLIKTGLAFVSTSKGVFPYDMEEHKFLPKIEGIDGDCGRIVNAGGHLFVETVKKQVIVVDPSSLKVIQRIDQACMPTLSRDQRLWVLRGQQLVAYDPLTLEEGQSIGLGDKAPNFSAGAWNAGLLFAGNRDNSLYWGYGKGWSGAQEVYRLKLDETAPQPQLIYSLVGKETPHIYGAAMRLRPADDHIFLQAFKTWGDKTYHLYELDKDGKELATYPLEEQHYWFPALMVFPDVENPTLTFESALPNSLKVGQTQEIGFSTADADSYASGIQVHAGAMKMGQMGVEMTDEEVLEAKIVGQKLLLRGVSEGERQLLIALTSNGLFSSTAYLVRVVAEGAGISAPSVQASLSLANGRLIAQDLVGETLTLHDASGRLLLHHRITQTLETIHLPSHKGLLIARAGKLSIKCQP